MRAGKWPAFLGLAKSGVSGDPALSRRHLPTRYDLELRQCRRSRNSRWRRKCFRLCEVNTIDYLAHPTYIIWVTASGRRPRHPSHVALGASHPAADTGGSPLAAIPAQLRIGLFLAPAHLPSPPFAFSPVSPGSRRPSQQPRGQIHQNGDGVAGRLSARCETTASPGAPVKAHTWWRGRPAALIHPRDRRSVRGRHADHHHSLIHLADQFLHGTGPDLKRTVNPASAASPASASSLPPWSSF